MGLRGWTEACYLASTGVVVSRMTHIMEVLPWNCTVDLLQLQDLQDILVDVLAYYCMFY